MKTILLIEDDAALRENTAELLELSNYAVITAPNGKVGIDKALEEYLIFLKSRINQSINKTKVEKNISVPKRKL